jgi:uncharacterized protein involved in response to NO
VRAGTRTAFAFLLVILRCVTRGVAEQSSACFDSAAGIWVSATLFLAYLIYVLGTNTFVL